MLSRKLTSLFLMFFIVSCSLNVYGMSSELKSELSDSVVLFANSNLAYAKNNDTYIDTTNADVKTIVENGRTLIPLRFISENFGAAVSYDAATKTAIINANNKTIKFTANDNTMLIDKNKTTLDVPAKILNGRMLVPLRALTENGLGKQIFYDKGLIVISDTQKAMDDKKVSQLITKFDSPLTYQLKPPAPNDMIAVIKTNFGDIKIKLFYEDAPLTVENFVRLAQKGYYNDVIFHRVIKDFMIQGGDPLGTGTGGESFWGKPFKDEFSDRLFNIRGALSMANRGANTNGSQFFIVQNTNLSDAAAENLKSLGLNDSIINYYSDNGGTPWLDGKHTVFGQVFEGMDVVDKIANVNVDASSKPSESVKILGVNTYKFGYEGQPIEFKNSAYKQDSSAAADFELKDPNGKIVKLSDYKGKTIVLNFWAIWCSPCRNEMPEINKVANEFKKSTDAVLLSINLGDDLGGEKDNVVKFFKDNNFDMNLLFITNTDIEEKFRITEIPTTIIIDKDGNIENKIVGSTSYEAIMKIVNNIR